MVDENDKEVEGERENKRHTQCHDARTNRKKNNSNSDTTNNTKQQQQEQQQ